MISSETSTSIPDIVSTDLATVGVSTMNLPDISVSVSVEEARGK